MKKMVGAIWKMVVPTTMPTMMLTASQRPSALAEPSEVGFISSFLVAVMESDYPDALARTQGGAARIPNRADLLRVPIREGP